MKVAVWVLAIFVFAVFAPEVGLAGQSAFVGAKYGKGQSWDAAVSQGKKNGAVGLAQNTRANNNPGETGKVTGGSNASQLGTTKKGNGFVSPQSVGRAFSQRSSANAGINGANFARIGSGPAIIGGSMKNTGIIDGTTFRHK